MVGVTALRLYHHSNTVHDQSTSHTYFDTIKDRFRALPPLCCSAEKHTVTSMTRLLHSLSLKLENFILFYNVILRLVEKEVLFYSLT